MSLSIKIYFVMKIGLYVHSSASILIALSDYKGFSYMAALKHAFWFLLCVIIHTSTAVANANADDDKVISKRTVAKFLNRNRDDMVEYQCDNQLNKSCSVTCSSGGNDYVKAVEVKNAFYSERRSTINGAVTGYYLVIDTNESKGGQDMWATLQLESSCLFMGMTPIQK